MAIADDSGVMVSLLRTTMPGLVKGRWVVIEEEEGNPALSIVVLGNCTISGK